MYKTILIFHILSGATCLLSGATAIFSRKGGRLHTRAGNVFYYGMYGVAGSALVMTLMKFNPFLLSIAIFSVYGSYTGRKAIDYWRLRQVYTPVLRDRIPCYIGLVTGLFMVGYPVAAMIQQKAFFVPVLAIFGVIQILGSMKDMKRLSVPEKFRPGNKEWLFVHIGKMSGAYIATVTAFLLNNFHVEPFWVLWLLPTAVGVPLIFLSISKWDKKLNKGKMVRVVA